MKFQCPERVELTPSQRRRCNRLIKKLCANYDGGNCLPLDEGDGCVCVQMISLFSDLQVFSQCGFTCRPRSCMHRFSDSVLITASNAGQLLCQIPTGRNTARLAAKEFTAGKKTRAKESAEVDN